MLRISPEEGEVWRSIPGYEGKYEASSLGRVRSVARIVRMGRNCRWQRSKVLIPFPVNCYPTVNLCVKGKRRVLSVHRAVCLAFHGLPPSDRHEVAHGDGTRDNNRPENLRWATRSENQSDRTLHGTQLKPWTTDEATALEIIARLNNGEGQKTIAKALGVSRWTVQHIWRGRSWKSLQHLLRKEAA